jgi:hypothetical protein
MRKVKKEGIKFKLFIVALASFLMLVFCIGAASPDSSLRFIDPTPANYTQEQDFTGGVLAINTHKSIYLPNEAASIGIAVLDSEGHMICDADVTLTITDPSNNETVLSTGNGLINVSPQCGVYGVTNLPDYYTNYTVDGAGTYVMNLTVTAVTAKGTKSITDVFTVQNSVDFDVARDGATRIYPSVPYVMNFTIKANKNYTGLIREYVPASFVITPQDGLTVTTVGDAKILTWTKNLVKGETYNIYYEFDAPDVSPYLFTLGELESGGWKEARKWMIASDAPHTETLRPNEAGTYQAWATFGTGSSHYGRTSDGSDTTGVQITYDITSKETENLADPTFPDGCTINSVTVYAKMKSSGGGGGGEKAVIITRTASTDYESTHPFTVDRVTWTDHSEEYTQNPGGGAWTKTQIAALQVGSRASTLGSGETLQCSEYWVVVDYKPTWESYKELGHTTIWGTVADPYASDTHIVYMYGQGFQTNHPYKVGYYDAGGHHGGDLVGTGVGGTSTVGGEFSSQCDCMGTGKTQGTWHSVVFDTTVDIPDNYNDAVDDANYVTDDAFEVADSAIPEFPTVVAAIAVCMLCAVAYVVMRRRAGRGDG